MKSILLLPPVVVSSSILNALHVGQVILLVQKVVLRL